MNAIALILVSYKVPKLDEIYIEGEWYRNEIRIKLCENNKQRLSLERYTSISNLYINIFNQIKAFEFTTSNIDNLIYRSKNGHCKHVWKFQYDYCIQNNTRGIGQPRNRHCICFFLQIFHCIWRNWFMIYSSFRLFHKYLLFNIYIYDIFFFRIWKRY